MTDANEFVHLQDAKSFSRLLYTNPVCLLATLNPSATPTPTRNVMVISWLTPTNNSGKFVMSVNKRRHTAGILVPNDNSNGDSNSNRGNRDDDKDKVEFVLCVPVAGMEDLVRNVGKMSGRWGDSKFPRDQIQSTHSVHNDGSAAMPLGSNAPAAKPSTRKRNAKKKKFENGINGLVAVKIGTSEEASLSDQELFGIHGTVAHLKCTTCGIVKEGTPGVDEDHYLIFAEVTGASVKRDYWNEDKKQFQPMKKQRGGEDFFPPPYMTFFGSQSFGYVVTHDRYE